MNLLAVQILMGMFEISIYLAYFLSQSMKLAWLFCQLAIGAILVWQFKILQLL